MFDSAPDGGRLPAAHLRQGVVTVNGRLPAEVIQRIVRQNFGRFKLCYADGLRRDPKLAGTVVTKFVVDRTGSITNVTRDASTTMTDATVVACVTRGFGSISFPQPEEGTVIVVYPIVFTPPDTL
jgi:Ca-activated chloride channel family protein